MYASSSYLISILPTQTSPDGAGLFYTTPLPQTLQILRQYALHMLFAPPAPSPAMSGNEAPAPTRNPFPFPHKPNTLDRDRIVIPAGWDSWGKISVLRDGFDAKAWGEAWEHDLDHVEGEPAEEPGSKKLFASLVPDQGDKVSYILHKGARCLITFCSLLPYRPSIILHRNKSSWRRTTTRIPDEPIAIPEAHSGTRPKIPQLVLLALWAAAASTCQIGRAHV